MEQKTEAYQAVDELLPCPFCGLPASLKSVNDWHSVEVDHDGNCPLAWSGASLRTNSVDAKWITSVWNRRAALKAQPAPTEAFGEPFDPKDETIKRLQGLIAAYEQIIAGHEARDKRAIKYANSAQISPTEAAQGEDSARLDWKRITAPGQVKVGDKLRFSIGDEKFRERVKQIINEGRADEELIYNKRRNFYVITSNAITNFGSSKNVEYLARASAETGGVKS